MSEHQSQPDFVKNKISENSKTRSPLARGRKEQWPKSLAKVIKKAISISELLTERDQAANVRVLREAKVATHRVFDPATRQLIEVPDHKTRLAAITLELAYTEGRPVERQIQLQGDFEDFATFLKRLRGSPEARRALPAIDVEYELLVSDADSLQSGPSVTSSEKPVEGSVIQDETRPDAGK